MIRLTMIQNEKTEKELQNIENNFGKIVDIEYLNEKAYNAGKEELQFEITIELKNNFNFEIEECDENCFYIEGFEYGIWFSYDQELHEFDLKTKRHDYNEDDIRNMYEDEYKNYKTVKTAKAVINYIERFI